jgi:hypothetical protein
MTSAVASATMTATTAVASAPAATTMGCAMAPAIRSAMPAVGAAAVTVASAICATVAVVTTVAATKTIPISPMAIARPWVITTTRVAVTSAAIITAPVIAASVISVAVISVAVIVVVPGSDPDEHASYEVARPVVPVRCTIVGIIRVIAIGAAWGRSIVVVPRSNLNADRNLRGRCCCQQERRGDKYDVL